MRRLIGSVLPAPATHPGCGLFCAIAVAEYAGAPDDEDYFWHQSGGSLPLAGEHRRPQSHRLDESAERLHARCARSRIPLRDELLARIKSLDNAGNTVSGLQVWGGHYFYYKTEPGSDNRKLFTRDTLSSPERLLVDTEKDDHRRRQALLH